MMVRLAALICSSTGAPVERAVWRAWRIMSVSSCSVPTMAFTRGVRSTEPAVSASRSMRIPITISISTRVKALLRARWARWLGMPLSS